MVAELKELRKAQKASEKKHMGESAPHVEGVVENSIAKITNEVRYEIFQMYIN